MMRCTPAVLATVLLASCVGMPLRPASKTKDHAFISYRPAGHGQTRLAVKDLIDVKGQVTTAGSKYLVKHGRPASHDAKCLRIARARGVAIVGKTNVTEFAITASGENKYFGTPVNLIDKDHKRVPGGSSCGSAVAITSGRADIALGTDTAGSIRVPAACCGIAGLKTTYGLVPLDGVFPIAPEHLDTVGPMARDVKGLVEGMGLLQEGFEGRYAAAKAAKPAARNIRIGRLYVEGTNPKIDEAVDAALKARGFRVVPLSKDFAKQWRQADKDAKTVAAVGSWLNDKEYADKREVATKTKAIMVLGAIEHPVAYEAALKRKKAWQDAVRGVFRKVDFIALPTLKSEPPRLPFFGCNILFEKLMFDTQNTAPVNLAGNPALAVPIPMNDEKLPVTSLQLIGPKLSEAGLLNAGRIIEKGR